MEDLDYWRLCDELNIVQAALLGVGEDATCAEYMEKWEVEKRPIGYEAAKTAITHGLTNFVKYQQEVEAVAKNTHGNVAYPSAPVYLESLRERSIKGSLVPEEEYDMNGNYRGVIDNSLDLWASTIEVASLKDWLRGRGFTSGFFSLLQKKLPTI